MPDPMRARSMANSGIAGAKKPLNLSIVGATGAVGREVLRTVLKRWCVSPPGAKNSFPSVGRLRLLASSRSAGILVREEGQEFRVEELRQNEGFEKDQIVFFTAGSKIAEAFAPAAVKAGAFVIDNSSLFRMRSEVPLVVPEVNEKSLDQAKLHRVVANPNCTTAQMVMVLKPLMDEFGMKRILLSSYQAVSGKGQQGIDELRQQISDFAKGTASSDMRPKAFPHPIAFNCIPHIDVFQEDGFTGEEIKVMNETRKILGDDSLQVAATCVRVPVLNGHSETVAVELKKPFRDLAQVREILARMPGVQVLDEPSQNKYPIATQVSGQDDVFVGRIRRDPSLPGNHGLLLWIVGDNLRKGAALNAVQIGEALWQRGDLTS